MRPRVYHGARFAPLHLHLTLMGRGIFAPITSPFCGVIALATPAKQTGSGGCSSDGDGESSVKK